MLSQSLTGKVQAALTIPFLVAALSDSSPAVAARSEDSLSSRPDSNSVETIVPRVGDATLDLSFSAQAAPVISETLVLDRVPVTGHVKKIIPISGDVGTARLSFLQTASAQGLYVYITSTNHRVGDIRTALPAQFSSSITRSVLKFGPSGEVVFEIPHGSTVKMDIWPKDTPYQNGTRKELAFKLEVRSKGTDGRSAKRVLSIEPVRDINHDGWPCTENNISVSTKVDGRPEVRTSVLVLEERAQQFEGLVGGPPVFAKRFNWQEEECSGSSDSR